VSNQQQQPRKTTMTVFTTETKYTDKKQVEKIVLKYCKDKAIKNNIAILEMAMDALEIALDHMYGNVLGELRAKRKNRVIGWLEYSYKRDEILAACDHMNHLYKEKITECNEWKKLLKS
tara:strand:- start:51 stop:407 length:357 start_codon:yes stop_codon:yes gene_type:complete